MVFDASGISGSGKLRELYEFFSPVARQIAPSGAPTAAGQSSEALKRLRCSGDMLVGRQVG